MLHHKFCPYLKLSINLPKNQKRTKERNLCILWLNLTLSLDEWNLTRKKLARKESLCLFRQIKKNRNRKIELKKKTCGSHLIFSIPLCKEKKKTHIGQLYHCFLQATILFASPFSRSGNNSPLCKFGDFFGGHIKLTFCTFGVKIKLHE